jgi:hypothetical protein
VSFALQSSPAPTSDSRDERNLAFSMRLIHIGLVPGKQTPGLETLWSHDL